MTPAAVTDPATDLRTNGNVRVDVRADGRVADSASLPAAAGRFMDDLFVRLAAGQIVTLIPEQADVTIGQAADLLLVSRPFVLKLIDGGELPARGTASNPLVRYADVMAYKRRDDTEREKALTELTQLSQELGLY